MEGRETQVQNRLRVYTWKRYDNIGQPSSFDTDKETLPLDERFDRCKSENFLGNSFKGVIFGLESEVWKIAGEILAEIFGNKIEPTDSIKNLQGYYDAAKSIQINERIFNAEDKYEKYTGPIVPYELARWTSDVEFGRQILNGVNCVMVKRCFMLPSNFPVTQDMVKHFLVRSGDLEKEMEVQL